VPAAAEEIDLLVVLGGPQSPGTTLGECPHFDSAAEQSLIYDAASAGGHGRGHLPWRPAHRRLASHSLPFPCHSGGQYQYERVHFLTIIWTISPPYLNNGAL
jgi:hypothetical protein